MEFNKDRIIQESNQFLVAKGFNTEDKNIFLDEKNSLWKEFVSNKEFINNNPGILEKLEEGEYWAVNYQPKDNSTLGGEAWVFIDKNGRGVIFYFLLK